MSRPWSRPASRRSAVLRAGTSAGALVLAGSLAGCGAGFSAQTLDVKSPGDGTQASNGHVFVLNALVVSDGGQGGSVSMTIANRDPQSSGVRLQSVSVAGTQATVSGPTRVQPAGTLTVGGRGGTTATVSGAQLTPGALVPMTVDVSGQGTITLQAPVVTSTGYYATITPGASAGPSVTPEPSAAASNTPALPGEPTPGARPGPPGNNKNSTTG